VNNEPITDAIVVEDEPTTESLVVVPSSPVPTAAGVLMPFDADEVREAMVAYQRTVAATLDATDWQGTPGGRQSFVKKSGWRKIAKAFGLSVELVEVKVERDSDGTPTRAEAIARAIAPNGQRQDADGYCSVDESRFTGKGGRQKLENDLRATATTRAKNRAIADLVGMGEVSAEEMATLSATQPDPFTGDVAGVVADLGLALPPSDVQRVLDWVIADNGGVLPNPVGRALLALGRVAARDAANQSTADAARDNDNTQGDSK